MITGKRYIGREKLIAAALAGSQPAPWITPDHDTGAGSAATHPLIIIIIIENAITKGTGQVAGLITRSIPQQKPLAKSS